MAGTRSGVQSLRELAARYPGAGSIGLGDSPALSAKLIELIRNGTKKASCGALRDFLSGAETFPVVGRRDIICDWCGTPELVIETRSVAVCRFSEVDEAFALAEGEADSLQAWRDTHRRFFESMGGFDPDMEIVCHSFRLVEDLA